MTTENVCIQCGACCAALRVSFYWGETDAHPDGTVPQDLTVSVSPIYVSMRGTERSESPRCVALDGEVGKKVGCTIYEQRSSTCRAFSSHTPECNKVRAKHGLPALPLHAVFVDNL